MGYDYAWVHLKFNIPPALLLTFLYRPLLTRLDVYRVIFLVTIAVVYTTPWDSYLIRNSIWSYPDDVIIGPKLFDIPLEEVFFFVIQTYNTSLLYLILSKAPFHPTYLRREEKKDFLKVWKTAGQVVLALAMKRGIEMVKQNKEGTYMGLIMIWAIPVMFLLWVLAYQFILSLPLTNTVLPIALPTLYLWVVDTLALRRGTWVIESGTKLGIHVWPHLEIEEAVFFLVTNMLVVWGLLAFDNAVAVLDAFPFHFPIVSNLPSPVMLVRALLLPSAAYDEDRINGLKEAVSRLSKKSRSFYLASGVFEGRLRVDLILLYSYCRVADDLVDNASSVQDAKLWIKKLSKFLDLSYRSKDPLARDANQGSIVRYVVQNFPRDTHSALLQLQTERLPSEPLYDLLKGFEMDLKFQEVNVKDDNADAKYPIKTEQDLDLYSQYVAGTVASLCLDHCFYHFPGGKSEAEKKYFTAAGGKMGMALQYTNIARDIEVDAAMGRIYIPVQWLKKEKLTPSETIKGIQDGALSSAKDSDTFFADKIDRLRSRLLDRAFQLYEDARPAIEQLPSEVRGSMRVAVESYMEIGRTLRKKGYVVKRGRATVPKWRRLLVAWKALNQ
ncbi:bifunctional lycopene cyclase/phytoene synthase [Elsinoe australis]|uniref:Bifunctional lycopene cyclase/phytoene synthase n=1 Tax=Elsinoe australis TaxID=40998 RepID=A0A4U7B4W5_9PEZI|nr:bifunctional lycopene cyclase/phytoene synthase [Elsinoe australis]